jgi:hypothetical protein
MLTAFTIATGAVLGLRYKVLILVPALLFVLLAVIGGGVARGAGIWAIALEMLVASTALQLGYVAGSAFDLARRPMSAAMVRLMRSMLERGRHLAASHARS